ncbi:MAG: DegV family protein [Clostridia bacterium]|nr:DegV family protein [Clostridia bacterium]
MKKIGLMIDTAADMPKEYIDKYDLKVINFMVTFGDESFIAHEEISNEEFFDKVHNSGIHPKTAQTPFQTLYDGLLEAAKECETLIFFTLSSKGSGQYQSGVLAAKQIMEEHPELDIRVVDTMTFSLFIAGGVLYAAKLIEEGKNADEVVDLTVKYINTWDVCFLVDDLNYLQRGGRIKKTTAVIGSMLDIKPVLGVEDGIIASKAKLRGKKKLGKKLIELIKEDEGFDPNDNDFMFVHNNPGLVEETKQIIKEEFNKDVMIIQEIGPVIGAHTGPGVFAVFYRKAK